MVRVLVAVAHGSEEIETVTPVDIIRRAGAEVTLAASGNDLQVRLSRGVSFVADDLIKNSKFQSWDMVVVPGGQPGANNLREDPDLLEILRKQRESDKWYAAICASPAVVLEHHGLLEGLVATAFPSVCGQLRDQSRIEDRVVVSNKCITSRSAGTAMEFSLEIVKALFGEEKANEIANQVLAPPGH